MVCVTLLSHRVFVVNIANNVHDSGDIPVKEKELDRLCSNTRPCNCFAMLRRVRNCRCYYYYYSTFFIFRIRVGIDSFQTQLQNGTYYEHYIEEESSVVLTSFSGTFRIEVSYENLVDEDCILSANYEFLSESYTCSGKSFRCCNEC